MLDAIRIAEGAQLPLSLAGWPYDAAFAERELYPALAGSHSTILGALDRARLWLWMAAAAVVLCPSRWDEPFGLVAAESQAAGTPVVAYRRGALPEVIAEGETGYIVDEGDVDGGGRRRGQGAPVGSHGVPPACAGRPGPRPDGARSRGAVSHGGP